jgi:Zn-dependent M28 family amino/carboxypeptidase
MKMNVIIIAFLFSSSILFCQNESLEMQSIKKDLHFLTSLELPRNYQNTTSLNKVASYLKSELSKVCDSVGFQTYQVQGNTYKNVIGSIGLEHSQRIVIGAHYDVYGDSDGADDNASGVAGLLALVRSLSKEKLTHRIDVVFYTLEEPPFFRTQFMGSYVHAKYLKDQNINVKGMICLESIGYFCDTPNSQQYPIQEMARAFGSVGNYVSVVQNDQGEAFGTQIGDVMQKLNYIPTKPFAAPPTLSGVDFSDHLNYWKFGFQAVMITNTAFYRNQHYHTKEDTLETLDLARLNLVVKQLHKTLTMLYGKK